MITKALTDTRTTEHGVTDYSLYSFSTGKTNWIVVIAKGVYNYVTVKKPTPWVSLGTEFKTMDDAVAHYKNPTMKMNLRLIEMM